MLVNVTEADSVYWTPDGDSYLVMANNKINKYSVNVSQPICLLCL